MAAKNSVILLQRRLYSFFSETTLMRGAAYHHEKAVMAVKATDIGVTAEVVGSRIYAASVSWRAAAKGEIHAFCECPFFQEGDFCKHLWALILEIDTRRLSAKIPTAARTFNLLRMKTGDQEKVDHGNVPVGGPSMGANSSSINWRTGFQGGKSRDNGKTSAGGAAEKAFGIVMRPCDQDEESVVFEFYSAQQHRSGEYAYPSLLAIPESGNLNFGSNVLRASAQLILGTELGQEGPSRYRYRFFHRGDSYLRRIKTRNLRPILEVLLSTGKVFSSEGAFMDSLRGEEKKSFAFARMGKMTLIVSDSSSRYTLEGHLELIVPSDSTTIKKLPLQKLVKFAEPDLFEVDEGQLAFLDVSDEEKSWIQLLATGSIPVPYEDAEPFLEACLNGNTDFNLPKSLLWEAVTQEPKAKVQLFLERRVETRDRYRFDLKFQYGSRLVSAYLSHRQIPCAVDRKVYVRSEEEESRILGHLPLSLLDLRKQDGQQDAYVHRKDLIEFVKQTLQAGIPLEIENKSIQSSSDFQFSVTSGVDWFDVEGHAEFSGMWVKFPAILESISRGESFLPLPDGSIGLIGEALKQKLEKLSAFSDASSKGLRFSGSQGLLLDSLLENEENLKLDSKFSELREKIKSFDGLHPIEPDPSFSGKLREYQKEGLGWLHFLDSFGLGGILADDMGLGKTIQCLAFLDSRRKNGESKPSLVLAPKTLLSNWESEARKFTPDIKAIVLSGSDRLRDSGAYGKYDLVITTYQTMLRDFDLLKGANWDCMILDEAQAIKNPQALVSKAAKLIPAKFKLAMTGTPIENSIQDLFSISDFVNPGFLRGKNRSAHLKLSADSKEILARAFKPVILRRTKEQVLKDLPAKTEQLISVELESKQLKAYNELKRYYASQLLKEVSDKGINKSQIQILAALTRLRQAALHPGLIDPSHRKTKSAKFEVVLEMLEDILSKGHRALIFSQFTGLLDLLKIELNRKKIEFCYLDGKTTNRKNVVDEFKFGASPVFLMSLKAGGVGLNLVEADYVFLLDPWWNPAVESQAIDRVHRIGQRRAVNAYRFIAKNTVEEKILSLQQAKKSVSAEMLDGQSSLLRNLTAKDIEDLLS